MNRSIEASKNAPIDVKQGKSKPEKQLVSSRMHERALLSAVMQESEYSDPDIEEDEDEEPGMLDLDIKNLNDPFKVSAIADTIFINDQQDNTLDAVTPQSIFSHHSSSIDDIRKNVITWIIYISHDYSMGSNTWYQAIEYFDFLLAVKKVPRKEMHVAGITCLWMSAKFVERSVPKLKDLASYFNGNISIDGFLKYEKIILQAIDYQLSVPTPKMFIRRYLDVVAADASVAEAANFFCELTIWEVGFHAYHCDILAIAAVALGSMCIGENFPKERIIEYSHNQDMGAVKQCCELLLNTATQVLADPKNIIYQRYSNDNLVGVIHNLNLSLSLLENL